MKQLLDLKPFLLSWLTFLRKKYILHCAIVGGIVYYFGTFRFRKFKKMGIPGPTPWPFLGNFPQQAFHGIRKYDIYLKKNYRDVAGMYFGVVPTIVVFNLEYLKQILVKDSANFIDRLALSDNSYPMRKNILSLKGDEWRRVRSLVSPTFTGGKLKRMVPMIMESVIILRDKVKRSCANSVEINVKDICGGLTMEVIAKTMFAIDAKCQEDENDKFVMMAKKFFTLNLTSPALLLALFFPELFTLLSKLFGEKRGLFFGKEMVDFFVKAISKACNERRAMMETSSGTAPLEYHDFLALMIRAHHDEKAMAEATAELTAMKKGLTDEEILAQALIFMLAGFETTSTAMTLILYNLALYPEYQERCRKEILELSPLNEEVTYEQANKMVFLEQCFNETLRIYPPAQQTNRVCVADTQVGPFLIKTGTAVTIPIAALHMDPEVYPEPEKFDPDRFGPEEKHYRDAMSFMPFGSGPRNCVGMRFAVLEMKLAIATLLKEIEFLPTLKTPPKGTDVFSSLNRLSTKTPIILQGKICKS